MSRLYKGSLVAVSVMSIVCFFTPDRGPVITALCASALTALLVTTVRDLSRAPR